LPDRDTPAQNGSGVKRIASPRLILEPVTSRNAAILWRLMQSGMLREFQDVPRYARDDFERRVAARPKHFDARSSGRFEWLLVHDKEPIGWISLRVGDHMRGAAEIGYSVLAEHRGHGYATEAARALLESAFETRELQQIDACCVPENKFSRRLLDTLGFVELRVQRNGAIVRGKPVDIVIYELTRERWAQQVESAAETPTARRQIRS
jgi:RimJ/RimL family protein N-acetyltransferase